MIKMKRGTYGYRTGKTITAMTPKSPPFSLSEKEEKRLVDAGVAMLVAEQPPAYNSGMTMAQLKEVAAAYGVDASTAKTKAAIIEKIEAAKTSPTGISEPENGSKQRADDV